MTLDKEIIDIAKHHNGRYLLPHRYVAAKANKTDIDRRYDACQKLVNEGKAKWLTNNFEPGIELTTKLI